MTTPTEHPMSEERQDVEGLMRRLSAVRLVSLDDAASVRAMRLNDLLDLDAEDGGPGRAVVVRYDDFHDTLAALRTLREQVERLEQLRTTRWQGEDGGLPERLQIASTILMALGFPGPAGTCAGAAGHIEALRADREQVERLTPPHGTSAHDYYRAWREAVARADTLQRENEDLRALVQKVDVGSHRGFSYRTAVVPRDWLERARALTETEGVE